MAKLLKYSIGFDVSSDELRACVWGIDEGQRVKVVATRKFPNTPKGHAAAEKWARDKCRDKSVPVAVVMEATGNYHEGLAFHLDAGGFHVGVVLPNKAKRYMEGNGQKTKNDPVDAKGLARMGAEKHLEKWCPFPETIYKLRQLTRHHEQLQEQKTRLSNQLHAVRSGKYCDPRVEGHLEKAIKLAGEQVAETKREIEKTAIEEPGFKERIDKVVKIKGLGILTVATIIAETNAFALFGGRRQLTSYAGYDVVQRQSGKKEGKTRISKKGNAHIRRAMHMPAFSVVRYREPRLSALYERVYQRTGEKMKAYVAVQRKLLCLVYTLWTKNLEYDPGHGQTDCQGTPGDNEQRPLFGATAADGAKVAAGNAAATQDGRPCNKSQEALFGAALN